MELYQHLKRNLKVCKTNSSGTEIIVRCPYCLDSRKDPYKGHMYIQNGAPYKYYCQRCQSSGVVNSEFLNLLNCNDFVILNKIQKEYKEYAKKVNIKYGGKTNYFLNGKSYVEFPRPKTKNDISKVKYLEDRFGFEIGYDEINKYKIVFSIKEFLKQNKLNSVLNDSKRQKTINFIDSFYVGFLSADKSTIIFRANPNLSKDIYRYNNFTIFPELEAKKTYAISNSIDLKKSVFNIYLAEGVFDIIGVNRHIYDGKLNSNDLFIANAGKSFEVSAHYINKLSILNANINIFSDKDVNLKFYKDLMKTNMFFKLNGMNIYYNNKNKDFGDRKEDIVLSNKIVL